MTIHYLEMKSKNSLIEKPRPEGVEVVEAEIKNYRFNKYLYQLVGEKWNWSDKLVLSNNEWKQYSESENMRTWVAYSKGSIVGYYELECQDNGNIELAHLGLTPNFIGQGFGGYLLSHAIWSAWSQPGVKRVWLHTCSSDHPNALINYKARGFSVYDVVHS